MVILPLLNSDSNIFFTLKGTAGLDGRDGVPGEPGLDGIPGRAGEFKL